MTTVDLINQERRRYLRSGRTRRDWVRYVVAIESIRRHSEPGTGTGSAASRYPAAAVNSPA